MHGGDSMICENKFCIYYTNITCTLHTISLDASGVCTDCILVDLNENILETARKQMRDKFDNIYQQLEKK